MHQLIHPELDKLIISGNKDVGSPSESIVEKFDEEDEKGIKWSINCFNMRILKSDLGEWYDTGNLLAACSHSIKSLKSSGNQNFVTH